MLDVWGSGVVVFGVSFVLAVAALAATWAEAGYRLSPDGAYYLQAAHGEVVPWPYTLRVLLPLVLGERQWAWKLVSGLSLGVSAGCLGLLTGRPIVAALLFIGLGGIFRTNAVLPVLVDAAAMAVALCATAAWHSHNYALFFTLLAIAGLCHERGPLFAGLWTANGIGAFLGLMSTAIIVALGWVFLPRAPLGPSAPMWLRHPFAEARKVQAWWDWRLMIGPWGVLLPMALWAGIGPWGWACLAAGYGQLLVAQDRARLYQWAAPALILVVCAHPWPPGLLSVLVLAHLWNPSRVV